MLFVWKKSHSAGAGQDNPACSVHDDPLSVQIDQFSESVLKAVIIQLSKGKEWFS